MNEIDETISFEEFRYTIDRLAWHKSPGINGTSPNGLKSLDNDDVVIIFELEKYCIEDGAIMHDKWKKSRLVLLPKKVYSHNLNN